MSQPIQPTVKDRLLTAFRALVRAEFPQYSYLGIYEYSVTGVNLDPTALLTSTATPVTSIDATPTDTTISLPSISKLALKPSIIGGNSSPTVGSICQIMFSNGDPTKPICMSCDAVDEAQLIAGGSAPTEHLMTAKATALMIYNSWVAIMAVCPPGPLTSVIIQPLLGTAITVGLAAQAAPAPPGLIPQISAAAAFQAGFATGLVPSPAIFAAWEAPIALLSTKTPNVSGQFPSVGCSKIMGG